MGDAELLAATLQGLQSAANRGFIDEILLVASQGSSDHYPAPASMATQMRWLHVKGERIDLLNAGLAAANGRHVLFLRPGVKLLAGAIAEMQAALSDPLVAGGAFPVAGSRAAWCLASWLKRLAGFLPLEACFVRRCVCLKLGGFRRLGLFEDVDFLQRLRREGRFQWMNALDLAQGDHAVCLRKRIVDVRALYALPLLLGVSPVRLAALHRRFSRGVLPWAPATGSTHPASL